VLPSPLQIGAHRRQRRRIHLPEIRIRAPAANSISIVPRPAEPADGASPAICIGVKPVGADARICRRQPKS
jgi:hypothetical protein